MSHYLAAFVLVLALALCVYLLTVLWQIHRTHSSAAWKFIFFGLTLLTAECAIGAHLAWISGDRLTVEEVIFIAIVLVKAVCYAVGFTIWKNDINWLKALARQRREQMQEDEKDKPEHPLPPARPTPGGPPAEPEDGEDDPGVPDDPGKSGQHP